MPPAKATTPRSSPREVVLNCRGLADTVVGLHRQTAEPFLLWQSSAPGGAGRTLQPAHTMPLPWRRSQSASQSHLPSSVERMHRFLWNTDVSGWAQVGITALVGQAMALSRVGG